jgi:DNA-binding NtrC family response regulator
MTENLLSALASPLNDYRVVIIEDEFLIALDLEMSVSDAGLRATVSGFASQKEHALKIGTEADIAFVDVNLADGRTGLEIGRILANDFGVSVIFMTGNPEMLGAGVAGTLGVMMKPVDARAVQQALAYAIAKRAGRLAIVPAGMVVFTA